MSRLATTLEGRSQMEDACALLESAQPLHVGAFACLLQQRAVRDRNGPLPDVAAGELIALADDGRIPPVRLSDQSGGMALPARSIVDLHAGHIGWSMVLLLEGGDPALPIVMGVLNRTKSQVPELPGHLEVDADGTRMLIAADEQLVLRCGKARITLTKSGKVVIEGTYLSAKSTGSNRFRGGSIQLN